ncbi:MAG TPA: 2-C-methyl-D-erythritol 2,4-cyclodiphosphate synthase [Elusimicrobia bacterium]|jgi:2-C-methyl-D-erythritol 2,4-cyclodiphosphate synthase|nr:2-C-methyl-D-erythritol 2,4-cyclodiphosphate synthase [Elusimicrobiota bacterium]
MRIGIGYDIHRLKRGRRLILGGVEIPYPKGLYGYSDADVLLHTIADALLGAVNLGDIGQHFPNTDPKYKNISSKIILDKVYQLVRKKGWGIVNIDSVIIAEEPELADYIPQMKKNIARVLKTKVEKISIKVTTNEGLGALGQKQGIAAYAVVSLKKSTNR